MRDTWNMTPDEAKKYILQNWFDGDENVNAFVCGDEEYTAMAIAVEALEATKWHYPSKGEYPPKGKQILAYAWNVHNVLAKYDTFDGKDVFVTFDAYNGFIEIKKVIRWQYIVPPKEEA
jgi:hypothetical protein